jgi:REP element-mobilizing transposase RayT
MENDLPKRKHPRLKKYDYSLPGAYFVTICTRNRSCVLSRIVGRGLAPAVRDKVECLEYGKVAEQQLLSLEKRYPYLRIDNYVIMPNHIHVIFVLIKGTAGASPRPTVMDIVGAFKSLTTLECKKRGLSDKLFQDSFYEHVIRDREDYEARVKYIYDNPAKWYYDELYSDK